MVSRAATAARTAGPPLAFAGVMVGVWYLISYVFISTPQRRGILLPPPHEVWSDAFADGDVRADLIDATWVTAQSAFIGLVTAIVLGVGLAIVMSLSPLAERALFPWAVLAQAVPILALVPIIGVFFQNDLDPWFFWLGEDLKKRVLVCVLVAIFPIITNTLFGLKSADRNLYDLLHLHGASRFTQLTKLELRAGVPAMFTGFRISAGLSVIGAVVGEFLFGRGEPGLGTLINRFRGLADGAGLIATIIVSSALGIVVFWVFSWLNRALTGRWHASTAAGP
ncbi:MAG: ABC transporter permease [Acidimicrobiales bacterium]